MKLIVKIAAALTLLYLCFWSGLAVYFSYAEGHKGLIESRLSRALGNPVSIENIDTAWQGVMPRLVINGFAVTSEDEQRVVFSFESLTAQVKPWSLLKLWPEFSEFSVVNPTLDISSLEDGQLQVAGVELVSKGAGGLNPKRAIRWFLDQHAIQLTGGDIEWRRQNGDSQRYQNISFEFERQLQLRSLVASVKGDKGDVKFRTTSQGDLFDTDDWDASFEILGDKGKPLLESDELSLLVQDGQGQLKLNALEVQRIRDFIRLTGLADNTQWLLDSNVVGHLHDVTFSFSGALFNMKSWDLRAAASGIGFKSVGLAPSMNNLSGELTASSNGGQFLFSTQESTFEWSRWFEKSFAIKKALGDFRWRFAPNAPVRVSLHDGYFEDENLKIQNLNAITEFDRVNREIATFGDLFKVESVTQLDYDDGQLVQPDVINKGPFYLDSSADFEIKDMGELENYLPKGKRFSLLRSWWSNAFLSGVTKNGKISYQGDLSATAFDQNKALFNLNADFSDVNIDYGYQSNWPIVSQAEGVMSVGNDFASIIPSKAFLGSNELSNTSLKFSSLFKKDLLLDINGELTMSLSETLDFIFRGPLIKADKRPKESPISSDKGSVDLVLEMRLPLKLLSKTKVKGTAEIRDGRAFFTDALPLDKLQGNINFTESSVESSNLTASFLGGDTQASIVTLEKTQPPKMEVRASGKLHSDALMPLLGEPILTWIDGASDWQGTVLIDDDTIQVEADTNLQGVSINAPYPLAKPAESNSKLVL